MTPPSSAFAALFQGAPDQRSGPSAGTGSPQGQPESGLGPQGGYASGPAEPGPRRLLDTTRDFAGPRS
jgi:hypothetical protein